MDHIPVLFFAIVARSEALSAHTLHTKPSINLQTYVNNVGGMNLERKLYKRQVENFEPTNDSGNESPSDVDGADSRNSTSNRPDRPGGRGGGAGGRRRHRPRDRGQRGCHPRGRGRRPVGNTTEVARDREAVQGLVNRDLSVSPHRGNGRRFRGRSEECREDGGGGTESTTVTTTTATV